MTREQAKEGSSDITIFEDACALIYEATERLRGIIDETELSEGELFYIETLKAAIQEFLEIEAEKIAG